MATIRISNDRELGTVNEDPATRQKEMEITEKWLGEIGGWQAMKAARMIVASGKVQVTERGRDLVRGHVGGEKSRLTSGLRIRSKSDVDNLCTCMMARRTGQICDHALAVALASLAPASSAAVADTAPAPSQQTASPLPPPPQMTPVKAPGLLSIFLPESLLQPGSSGNKSATAFLKVDPGEGESSTLAGWLKSHGVPLQNTPMALPPAELSALLDAVTNHPRVFIGKPGAGLNRSICVTDSEIRPLLKIQLAPTNTASDHQVLIQWAETPAPHLLPNSVLLGRTWLHHPGSGTLHPWKEDRAGDVSDIIRELLIDYRPGRDIRRPLRWLATHLSTLEEKFQSELSESLLDRYKVVPVKCQFSIHISGSLQAITLAVKAFYQGFEWSITSNKDPFPVEDQQIKGTFYIRNRNQEKRLFDLITKLGFRILPSTGEFQMSGNSEVLRFFASGLPQLESIYNVTKSDQWESLTSRLLRVAPVLGSAQSSGVSGESAGSGMDWLRMDFAYEASNGFQLSRADALRLIRSGQNTVKGRDGRQYVLDVDRCLEFEEALQDVPLELNQGGMRLRAAHQNYFLPYAARATLAGTQDVEIDLEIWRQKLGDLGATLRAYQIEGVAWLSQRIKEGNGALLGDDMGLGKTLQSIALIRYILTISDHRAKRALVICPKSLIPNWMAEFQRFAPELKVLAIEGAKRHQLFNQIDGKDVLITSYPLISRDLERYRALEFEIGVFDEASFLRNPDTETASAARELKLKSRLALSGTPVENGVRDLWSIFQILIPGYLGSRQSFSERFEKPLQIPGEKADATAGRLRRLIRPFFLRRTKTEVLKDLPEKIEQVFWCEMSDVQAEIYRRLLEEGREEIRNARRRSGQNGARMTMLTVLLRLRQVCCDVAMAGLPEEKLAHLRPGERSGKWEALDERLDEALSGGSKVLIFSQFVTYLQACRHHLSERGIQCAYLDGGTTDRAGQVASFQTDPQKRVFLISLKAGGYGLNLTQADHVFLMDPWWNPAVEAQAIDRAHRFGQSRVVNAYRFVMRGTVEERVLALQEKKRGLISATIEERAPLMEGLSDSDLESLLS